MKKISKLTLLTLATLSLTGCSIRCDKNAFLDAINEIYSNPIPRVEEVEFHAEVDKNGGTQKYDFKKSEIYSIKDSEIFTLYDLMCRRMVEFSIYKNAKFYKGSTYKVVVNGGTYIDIFGNVIEQPDLKFTVKFDKYGNQTSYNGYLSENSTGKITATYTYAK